MPSQLSPFKRRTTIAEHTVVLDMLEHIAEAEETTTTELIREAVFLLIKEKINSSSQMRKDLLEVLESERSFTLPKNQRELAQLKRHQRFLDSLQLDLGLKTKQQIQEANSIHRTKTRPKLVSSF